MNFRSMAGGARGAARDANVSRRKRAARPRRDLSLSLILRSVRTHKIDQCQRTLEHIRVKSLREHVPVVGGRLLIEELMLMRLLRERFMNNANRDALRAWQMSQNSRIAGLSSLQALGVVFKATELDGAA